MPLIKKYWITVVSILAGGAAGYFYWRYVGCTSGSCPITSNPVHSSLYGALMGGLFTSSFKKKT